MFLIEVHRLRILNVGMLETMSTKQSVSQETDPFSPLYKNIMIGSANLFSISKAPQFQTVEEEGETMNFSVRTIQKR